MMKPPISGPPKMPPKKAALKPAKASPRCSIVETSATSARSDGSSAATAKPCTIRRSTQASGVAASAKPTQAKQSSASPVTMIQERPSRSDNTPNGTCSEICASRKAAAISPIVPSRDAALLGDQRQERHNHALDRPGQQCDQQDGAQPRLAQDQRQRQAARHNGYLGMRRKGAWFGEGAITGSMAQPVGIGKSG